RVHSDKRAQSWNLERTFFLFANSVLKNLARRQRGTVTTDKDRRPIAAIHGQPVQDISVGPKKTPKTSAKTQRVLETVQPVAWAQPFHACACPSYPIDLPRERR